jgi:hypothetical protein
LFRKRHPGAAKASLEENEFKHPREDEVGQADPGKHDGQATPARFRSEGSIPASPEAGRRPGRPFLRGKEPGANRRNRVKASVI